MLRQASHFRKEVGGMKLKVKETLAKLLDTTPIGKIVMYAGNSAPRGWLLCQGQAVSRTTYAKLFSVIGTTYGNGDGSTTFNVPDMRGRSPLGVGNGDATGHTNHTLGQKGGEETHTLSVGELAKHNHNENQRMFYSGGSYTSGLVGITQGNWDWSQQRTGTAPDYGKSVSGTMKTNTDNTGSNTAHNTLHPYLGINFIIYVGGGSA